MKTTIGKQAAQMNMGRYSDLKVMLEDRRREILNEVQGKIRDQRDEQTWGKVNEVRGAIKHIIVALKKFAFSGIGHNADLQLASDYLQIESEENTS